MSATTAPLALLGTGDDPAARLAEVAAGAGLWRVEIVAWRDLAHPEAGGSELHAARIAERWSQAGVDVTLKASRSPGQPPLDRNGGVSVRRPAGRYGIFPSAAVAGMVRARRSRPDGVVEIWNGVPFLSPLWAGCARTVFLHHVHDGMWDLTLPRPLATVGKLIEVKMAPRLYRSTPVVTLSESSRRTIIDRLGLDPAQIHVVQPGVDPFFSPGGTRAEHPFFVAVGRLMPYKRYDVLIEALVEARRRHGDLRAVIVGTGRERAALQARVDHHGAGSWLELPGHLDRQALRATYRRAWAVLSASAFEGWGMTLTEAGACHTPAIASAIAGHTDAVHHGTSGLLFDTGAQLQEALEVLIGRPALRKELQDGAARRAASLSWDRTALGTFSVLAGDALRRRQPAGGAARHGPGGGRRQGPGGATRHSTAER